MKSNFLKCIILFLSLLMLYSCAPASMSDPDTSDSTNSTGTVVPPPPPPGALGEPLSQEGVVQDYEEGAQVQVAFEGKYTVAYYYDPDDSDEFIVFIDSVPNDEAFRSYATIYKPDFNGVNGFITALSEGVFQAAYFRKIIFAADEAEFCCNSTILMPKYCSDGEIITGINPSPFAGEGPEQYYCALYDDDNGLEETAKEYMIVLPGGRFATIVGNKVANINSGKQVTTAESNFKRLFERYSIDEIFR